MTSTSPSEDVLAARVRSGTVSQWETSGRLVWILSAGLLALGIAAYVFGLPLVAQVVANRLPISAVQGLSDQVLAALDRDVFSGTQLQGDRRAALTTRFSALQWPGPVSIPMRVEFRKSDEMGANALALPSGTIVVTDELIALARSDDEIIGVLAHEAGHVQERHGLRSIIQSSLVSLAVTWIVGDVGTLVAIAPTALLQAKYSRDLERNADAYAAQTLSRNGLSTSALADMLERMDAAHGGRGQFAGPLSYVSTHPATADRIAALRGRR